ncbi:hypothetical protein HMPREF1549_01252 [Actinomyces johnsonii F0510]|uniref:Uncharacterized protein n=1 Tax=Actinomyces johnsonii F0510 TaxID=1227262 RepID=U1PX39_9ACTO|nr:hypothetical protein HMPREF1549_01252 [Actinomyces johnsonii F0510]
MRGCRCHATNGPTSRETCTSKTRPPGDSYLRGLSRCGQTRRGAPHGLWLPQMSARVAD